MCDLILPDIWSFLCNFLDKIEKKFDFGCRRCRTEFRF